MKAAEGYNAGVTLACERTLLTLLCAFITLKTTIHLVGGLVPRYLTLRRHETSPHTREHRTSMSSSTLR